MTTLCEGTGNVHQENAWKLYTKPISTTVCTAKKWLPKIFVFRFLPPQTQYNLQKLDSNDSLGYEDSFGGQKFALKVAAQPFSDKNVKIRKKFRKFSEKFSEKFSDQILKIQTLGHHLSGFWSSLDQWFRRYRPPKLKILNWQKRPFRGRGPVSDPQGPPQTDFIASNRLNRLPRTPRTSFKHKKFLAYEPISKMKLRVTLKGKFEANYRQIYFKAYKN